MRRKYFGWAIAMVATLGPMQAWGGDREIAEQIIKRLKVNRDSGALKDFTLDMKVDQGVVLFRGNVSQADQKELVLQAAEGVEGIAEVVDDLTVGGRAPAKNAKLVKPQASVQTRRNTAAQADSENSASQAAGQVGSVATVDSNFSFRDALASESRGQTDGSGSVSVVPGRIMPTAAVEPAGFNSGEPSAEDQKVISAVVNALGQAQQQGRLKGFGVEVKSQGGVIQLSGRAGSPAQRDLIVQIAEQTPGVASVREAIVIPGTKSPAAAVPQPPVLRSMNARPATGTRQAARPQRAAQGRYQQQARLAAARGGTRAQAARYRMAAAGHGGAAAGHGGAAAGHGGAAAGQGAPVMGNPVPVPAGHAPPAGAPRHDSPYLPNHAWPGYAAYPNYAAVTYPQQYSPTAFPYIGPFYPYPQVPLGWRKVSLEWDDGWWFLDFTDK